MKKYLIVALLISAPQAWANDHAEMNAMVTEVADNIEKVFPDMFFLYKRGDMKALTPKGAAIGLYLENEDKARTLRREIESATDRMERMRESVEQMQKNMGLQPEHRDETLQIRIESLRRELALYENKIELLRWIILKNDWAREKASENGVKFDFVISDEDFEDVSPRPIPDAGGYYYDMQ